MTPILSIIIPAYNASKYINKCLDAIFVHGGLEKDSLNLIETIVVDDCSKDKTSIIRKSKFPQNPKRSVRFSGKRTKRSVQKRKARNTQKAETKVL